MAFIREPYHYSRFQCIAGACDYSCCVGWEVDIDEDTEAYYRSVEGPFGDRLREKMIPAAGDEEARIILKERRRCEFLNDCDLCDIFIELGEEHLSEVCTEHPRFFEYYTCGTERGVGLSCRTAVELILERPEDGTPELTECPDPDWEEPEEVDPLEVRAEGILFPLRGQMLEEIRTDGPLLSDDRMNDLFRRSFALQADYEQQMFDDRPDDTVPETPFTELFFSEKTITALIGYLKIMEVNEERWTDIWRRIRDRLPELLAGRGDFLAKYSADAAYDRLLIHYIIRHFMKGRFDDAPAEKLRFALLSVCCIQLLDMLAALEDGGLTRKKHIDMCSLYCREIEYSVPNLQAFYAYTETFCGTPEYPEED